MSLHSPVHLPIVHAYHRAIIVFRASFSLLVCPSSCTAVAYSAGGTLVLRRIDYRTPLAVGFLIGVGAVMANVMLLVAG